jgi:hypothetical protein
MRFEQKPSALQQEFEEPPAAVLPSAKGSSSSSPKINGNNNNVHQKSQPKKQQANDLPVVKSTSTVAVSSTEKKKEVEESKSKVTVIAKLFSNMKFVFSGIPEKLRERLEILVKQYDGKVLSDIPKETNYNKIFQKYQQQQQEVIGSQDSDVGKDDEDAKISLTDIIDEKRNNCLKELTVLISQPKDFRKPKFITAVILGIPILHMNYLYDSIQLSSLQAFPKYALPVTYSAVHSYNIMNSFPLLQLTEIPQKVNKKVEEKNSKTGNSFYSFSTGEKNAFSGHSVKNVFENLRILNLTGMKIWDEILLLCTKNLLRRQDKNLYKQILSEKENKSGSAFPVDIIVFDPITYTKSFIHHKRGSSNTDGNENIVKQNLLTELEIRLLKHCRQIQQEIRSQQQDNDDDHDGNDEENTPLPFRIVSIDWITHCIAMNELLPEDCLDLFQLPNDPIHYPMAFKTDSNETTSNTTTASGKDGKNSTAAVVVPNAGERYSKYDLVYFTTTNQMIMNNNPSSSSSSTLPAFPMVGKILSFSRRNENSLPLVKIQMIDQESKVIPGSVPAVTSSSTLKRKANQISSNNNSSKSQEVKSLTPKKFISEMIISVNQLLGKIVLLHRKDYYKVNGFHPSDQTYSLDLLSATFPSSNSSGTGGSGKKDNQNKEEKLKALVKEMEEEIFSTTIDYEKQFPVIVYQKKSDDDEEENDESEEEGSGDEENDGRPRKRKKRFLMSQDI